MGLRLLLLWVLTLLGCGGRALPTGDLLARYVIQGPDGAPLGQASVWQSPTGTGWVEHLMVPPAEKRAVLDIWSRWAPVDGAWSYARHQLRGQALLRFDVRYQPNAQVSWRQQQGLALEHTTLADRPQAQVLAQPLPGQGVATLGLIHWQELLPLLAAGGADAMEFTALNLLTGRQEPLLAHRLADQELRVEGQSMAARRWFLHTAAQGWTLWLDPPGEHILGLDNGLGGASLWREGVQRPAEPPAPLPEGLMEEDLLLPTPQVRLAGTLTRPTGSTGPLPTIVLIHGSGGLDRDGDVAGLRHHMFRTLAWRLAPLGFAVLRYDKRGVGQSRMEGEVTATLQDLAGDVTAWMDHLAQRPDLHGGSFFLLGHSEGAWIAPLVAARDDRVRGVVMLGGAASPLQDILKGQLQLILAAHGVPEPEAQRALRHQDAVIRGHRQRSQPRPAQPPAGPGGR